MTTELTSAHQSLWDWCRKRDFAGYDPFDALNSKLFQATPLKHSRAARLAWTQLLKRSPINIRGLARVPSEKNPKGEALFALAALANFRRLRTVAAEQQARQLLESLLAMRLKGWSGAAWGYNFDWQSRVFFAPRGTPTIVPTAFSVRALTEATQAFEDDSYLKISRSACEFIIQELPRTEESPDEICFSYAPGTATRIYNASLLAGEALSCVGALTGERDLCSLGTRTARYVIRRQREDGSWPYGADPSQSWVDNFHTAFVLFSLARIANFNDLDRESEIRDGLKRGYEFWRKSLFLADGAPKYYHDSLYPVDVHAAATAIVTLSELRKLDNDALRLAEQVALWSIRNLRDRRGFFYYQQRRFFTVRTPFMRWSEAWMLYALSRLLEETKSQT